MCTEHKTGDLLCQICLMCHRCQISVGLSDVCIILSLPERLLKMNELFTSVSSSLTFRRGWCRWIDNHLCDSRLHQLRTMAKTTVLKFQKRIKWEKVCLIDLLRTEGSGTVSGMYNKLLQPCCCGN